MVTTRSHPSTSQPPSKKSTISRSTLSKPQRWSHTPTPLTILWLFVSLPLVTWDTLYVLLRPHSMPGGHFHSPLFTPYALYGIIDHVYGWPAYNAHDGFTAAQSTLNIFETVGYLVYLSIIWGREKGEGKGLGVRGRLGAKVDGVWGAGAALLGFAISVMTLSKTVLYVLNEFHSGFKHIGHNDAFSLLFLWIIPNGAWIVLPTYMVYVFARDILQGLVIATRDMSPPTRRMASIKDE